MTRRLLLAALAGIGLLVCTNPPAPNEEPVIEGIDGPGHVSAHDSAWFSCRASDPEGRYLTYEWTCDRGVFRWDWGVWVRWIATDTADTARFVVTVTDDSGLAVVESTTVWVMRDSVEMLYWDGAVRAGDHRSWWDSVEARHTIAGSSTTVADSIGDVYLLIFSEAEYQNWLSGGSPHPLLQRIAYKADSFAVMVPATDQYRIVIDNSERTEDYNFWLRVLKISP